MHGDLKLRHHEGHSHLPGTFFASSVSCGASGGVTCSWILWPEGGARGGAWAGVKGEARPKADAKCGLGLKSASKFVSSSALKLFLCCVNGGFVANGALSNGDIGLNGGGDGGDALGEGGSAPRLPERVPKVAVNGAVPLLVGSGNVGFGGGRPVSAAFSRASTSARSRIEQHCLPPAMTPQKKAPTPHESSSSSATTGEPDRGHCFWVPAALLEPSFEK